MIIYNPHRFCIAPMMEWTDRHFRYLARLLSERARLYTEMVTTGALLYGDTKRFLDYDAFEKPLALQLGGSDVEAMRSCAELAQQWGYDEVNINVGCPSDRVQSGQFGACLMRSPERVAACVRAMTAAVDIPVTVKTRLGVDEHDSIEFLQRFLEGVIEAGCGTVILHARKALLSGLNPKENREVPPLNYQRVHHIKQLYPDIRIIVNGGIDNYADIHQHLKHVDGVMLGRHAYKNPLFLYEVDRQLFNRTQPQQTPEQLVVRYVDYMREQSANGVPLSAMTKHLLGFFQGQAGARRWRRYLSENMHRPDARPDWVLEALEHVVGMAVDATPKTVAG